MKTHNFPDSNYVAYPSIIVLNIFRDPRDVIVSTINYLSWLPTDQGGWGEDFARLDFKQKFKKFMLTDWHLSILEKWNQNNDVYKMG